MITLAFFLTWLSGVVIGVAIGAALTANACIAKNSDLQERVDRMEGAL